MPSPAPRSPRPGSCTPALRRVLLVVGAAGLLLAASAPALLAAPPEQSQRKVQPEVSAAAARFLNKVDTAKKEVLLGEPGLSKEVVEKIMAHRAAGKKFANLIEFRSFTGISKQDLEHALKPYDDAEQARKFEATRKPVPEPPPSPGKAARRLAADAPQPVAGSGNGPIVEVRPGYYAVLPGYEELDKLDPLIRKEFLERVNREMCSCGCQNETLAFCLVNDPGCPVVKARVKKIYDDVTTKPPR